MSLYNYFVVTTEKGDGRKLYATVYRAPLGHTWMSTEAEKYCASNEPAHMWKKASKVNARGERSNTSGGKRWPGDCVEANAFMERVARRERNK